MEAVLGTDRANEIISYCYCVRAQWWYLGVRLGVLHSTLEATEAAHRGDVDRCLSTLISTWLRRAKGDVKEDVRPTWKSLCEALSYINGPLAETIARHHECGYINPIVSEVAAQPGAVPPTFLSKSCGCGRCKVQGWATEKHCERANHDDIPLLLVVDSRNPQPQVAELVRFEKRYDRQVELCAATSEIIYRFRSICLITWEHFERFESKGVVAMGSNLSTWLERPLPCVSNIHELKDLMHLLKVSWFNFEPLHFLAFRYLSSHSIVMDKWDNYKDRLIYYCQGRNLKRYANVFFEMGHCNVFLLEVDEYYNDFTLSDIRDLRKSLSTALDISFACLHLVTVKTGSLFIYFHYGYTDYLIVFQSLSAQQLREIASIKCYKILSLVDFYDQFKYKNIQEYCCLEEAVPKSDINEEDLSTSDSSEEIKLANEQLKKELDENRTQLDQCRDELKMYKKLSQNKDMQLSKKDIEPESILLLSSPSHSRILPSSVTIEEPADRVSKAPDYVSKLGKDSSRHLSIDYAKPKGQRYQVLSAEKTTQYTKDVEICILYSKMHFQRTRRYYTKKGYTIKTVDEVKNEICQEGISIFDVHIPDERWSYFEIGRQCKKITEEDIDMFKFLNCTPETITVEDEKKLEDYEDEGLYPPRFHLRFENMIHQATETSCPVTITLTGFVPDSDSDPAEDSFSHNISITTVLFSAGENDEEKDPFLIELMPYIEPILFDDLQTYYQFGTQLGLTIDQLTQLQYKFPDKEKCIMQMLLKWRDSSQSVSHLEISKALRTCGYPILSVILENWFSIKKEMEAAAPGRQYGGFAVITDSKPLNGCQIIAEKLKDLPQGDSILQDQPDYIEFYKHVISSIPSKWKIFGRQLNFNRPDMDAITVDNPHGHCSDSFTEVFDKWKKRNSPPFTWETVLSVVYSDIVKGYKAGERVYKYLMQSHKPNPT